MESRGSAEQSYKRIKALREIGKAQHYMFAMSLIEVLGKGANSF